MDSRLLNVYYDDPYEVDYDHFETATPDIWSTDNIDIGGMELTHSLDGILPIAAPETEHDVCSIKFEDEHFYDEEEFIDIRNQNVLVYNDFTQQQYKAEERVGTIDDDDANAVLSNDDNHSIINHKASGNMQIGNIIADDDDARSECSKISFRTRTDSSSIGDYESHTSDYDDDDENYIFDEVYDDVNSDEDGDVDGDSDCKEDILEKYDVLTELPEVNLFSTEDFMFNSNGKKQRTISTNTIGSDVDATNFDLADFITSDDLLAKPGVGTLQQPQSIQMKEPIVQVISSKLNENDSDSDIIVDVETVEYEDARERVFLLKNATEQRPEDSLLYVDNVKDDPSWIPNETIKSKQNSNKKLSDISKNGTQRGRCAIAAKASKNLGTKKQILKSIPANIQPLKQNIGLKGGKNLSLLKRDCDSIANSNNSSQIRDKEKDIALLKHDSHRIDPRLQNREPLKKSNETEKRKLNLEEYKRRQGEEFKKLKANPNADASKPKTIQPIKTIVSPNKQSPIKAQPKHSEAVTLVVKSLKEELKQNSTQKPDPITQAKNKVLRMQELKRAQQMKIIDSTISAKVPRVTKLLPLQELIKDTAYAMKNIKVEAEITQPPQTNPDYVKIVMVSAACNTVLSLSPSDVLPNMPLLDNITRVTEHVKISNNSLITSIQDAVVKQSLPKIQSPIPEVTTNCTIELDGIDHGEDKIIMHLRKDRINGPTRSVAIQTDYQAAFPTLPMPEKFRKVLKSKKESSRRKYRRTNAFTGTSSSSSESSESDGDDNDVSYHNEYITTKQKLGASTEYQNSEAAASVGGYSSRSSRRHRSSVSSSYSESGHHQRSSRSRNRKSNYKKSTREHSRSSSSNSSTLSDYSDKRSRSRSRYRSRSRSPYRESRNRYESNGNIGSERNVSKPAVEERRIVYVGRIEEETTKEMLRCKFMVYGSIRQITIHYKETGMKYGFVTFDRSEDAFSAIDNSTRDSQINMYDISFGGRRAFCRTSYADLDNAGINNYHSYVFPKAPVLPKPEDSFEALLQKVKAKLDANKTSNNNKT